MRPILFELFGLPIRAYGTTMALAFLLAILLAYGLMALLSSMTIDLKDNPFSMFFVNKHLYFFPTAVSIIANYVVILIAAFLISFLTARRAAKLRVADALRHYE